LDHDAQLTVFCVSSADTRDTATKQATATARASGLKAGLEAAEASEQRHDSETLHRAEDIGTTHVRDSIHCWPLRSALLVACSCSSGLPRSLTAFLSVAGADIAFLVLCRIRGC
jgi:hypothetical protein